MREQLLPRARLAAEDDRQIVARRRPGELERTPERLRFALDAAEVVPGGRAARSRATGAQRKATSDPEDRADDRALVPHRRRDEDAALRGLERARPHRAPSRASGGRRRALLARLPRALPPPQAAAPAASFAATTRPRASTATRASPASCAARNAYRTTSSRTLITARSRSSIERAIAFEMRTAWRRCTSHGRAEVHQRRPALFSPGAWIGDAAQLHGCHAETKCSEANTSTGLPSASAVPGPLVPATSSAQSAPGRKSISVDLLDHAHGRRRCESIQPSPSR